MDPNPERVRALEGVWGFSIPEFRGTGKGLWPERLGRQFVTCTSLPHVCPIHVGNFWMLWDCLTTYMRGKNSPVWDIRDVHTMGTLLGWLSLLLFRCLFFATQQLLLDRVGWTTEKRSEKAHEHSRPSTKAWKRKSTRKAARDQSNPEKEHIENSFQPIPFFAARCVTSQKACHKMLNHLKKPLASCIATRSKDASSSWPYR